MTSYGHVGQAGARDGVRQSLRVGPVLANLAVARRLESASPERVQAVQSALLTRLVRHAHAAVPYYRRVLDAAAVASFSGAADLRGLPVLDRMHLQELPAEDMLAAGFTVGNTKPATTSGSSGAPVTVRNSERDLGYLRAVYLDDLLASGLRPWDRLAYFRVRPFLQHPLERLGLLPSTHVDTSRPLDEQVEAFVRARPTFLVGFPNVIHAIVEELRRRGIRYRGVRAVLLGGERPSPALRADITDYFGARCHEVYASVEMFTIARSCPHGALHLRSADVVVEIERDDGSVTVEDGTGDVLLTRLRSEAMPLIRYRLGDRIQVEAADCPCGRQAPVVREVQGRSEDLLRMADGRLLHGDFISQVVQRFPVRRMQIVQDRPGDIDVYVVLARGAPDATVSAIHRALDEAVPQFSVHVRAAAGIAPEPNGKMKLVKAVGPATREFPRLSPR